MSAIRFSIISFFLSTTLISGLVSAEQHPLVVSYPASDHIETYTKRVNYFVELLDLALKKSGQPYRLEKVVTPLLLENRSKNNLVQKVYDVHWLNAKASLESDLIPIPIPLCKGLTGWRLLFIRPKSQKKFSQMNDLQGLGKLVVANGHDWPEADLYVENKLNQKLASNWKSLFLMLDRKRVDYISRSVLEIYEEENAFPQLNITIESDLIIHYPAAYYFYVDKSNPHLAEIIESGLKVAIADGSFDEMFNRYFSDDINRLNLSKRRRIEIPSTNNHFKYYSDPDFWYNSAIPILTSENKL